MAVDMFDRELAVDDFVVSNNLLYKVVSLPATNRGQITVILHRKSKTTKSVKRFSRDICRIPAEDITLWLMKKKWES